MNAPNGRTNGRSRRQNVPQLGPEALPGRQALLLGALVFGLIMMGIQLWLLTVALELYLGGEGHNIWGLAVGSGIVFAGGVFAVWLLSRAPRFEG